MTSVLTKKHVLELNHSSVRKEQSRIIAWNKGAAVDDCVPVTFEKLEERISYLMSFHNLYLRSRDLIKPEPLQNYQWRIELIAGQNHAALDNAPFWPTRENLVPDQFQIS